MAQLYNVKVEPKDEYKDQEFDTLTHDDVFQRVYSDTDVKIEELDIKRWQTCGKYVSADVLNSIQLIKGEIGRTISYIQTTIIRRHK